MNTKLLIGALVGFVALFALGALLYGYLLAATLNQYTNQACMKPEGEMNWLFLVIGNLGFGLLLSYIITHWASAATFGGGLRVGAIVGFLVSFSYNCISYATTSMMSDFTGALLDVAIFTVMCGIAGGVIGAVAGRK